MAKFKRILLKMSGEALMGDAQFGIDPSVLDRMAKDIQELVKMGTQVAVVLGGGNLFRGKKLSQAGLGRVTGDHMGMLATVMNGLAFRDALERIDLPARIMSAIPMTGVVDPYNRRKAVVNLRDGKTVIFVAGTGNPFFTTDTAACLRAIEIDADLVLKATKVDGVYDKDPVEHKDAKLYEQLTFNEVLQRDLQVMDLNAICLCRDHGMPLRVYNMLTPGILKAIVNGEDVGTYIGADANVK